MLLLRNNLPVPDSLIHSFAALDGFRFELYTDLQKLKKENLFPADFKTQESIARSQLMGMAPYDKPDTLVFLHKLPVQYQKKDGFLYFFKYKEKKEDNSWKIATAGIYPKDSTQLVYQPAGDNNLGEEDDFTELTTSKISSDTTVDVQLEKLRKKMLYSRRKSAAQFYDEATRYSDFDFSRVR
jgi:hypothetical protein